MDFPAETPFLSTWMRVNVFQVVAEAPQPLFLRRNQGSLSLDHQEAAQQVELKALRVFIYNPIHRSLEASPLVWIY